MPLTFGAKDNEEARPVRRRRPGRTPHHAIIDSSRVPPRLTCSKCGYELAAIAPVLGGKAGVYMEPGFVLKEGLWKLSPSALERMRRGRPAGGRGRVKRKAAAFESGAEGDARLPDGRLRPGLSRRVPAVLAAHLREARLVEALPAIVQCPAPRCRVNVIDASVHEVVAYAPFGQTRDGPPPIIRPG